MRKRKVHIFVVCSMLCALAVWTLLPPRHSSSDDGRFRSLKRSHAAFGRVKRVESFLPGGLVRLLRLPGLESRYWRSYEEQRQHLLASGYLVEVPVMATNRTTLQTLTAIGKVFQGAGAYYTVRGNALTNRIVITCRPESVPLCAKAVANE
jgi:hypothetical protein